MLIIFVWNSLLLAFCYCKRSWGKKMVINKAKNIDKSPESKKFFQFRGLKSRWSKIPGVTWNPEPVNHLYLCRTKKVTVLLRCFSAWILIKIWQRNRLAVWNSNKVFLAGRVFRGVGCSWPYIRWLLSLAFSDSWFGLMIRKLSLTLKFIGRVKSKRATINNFFAFTANHFCLSF